MKQEPDLPPGLEEKQDKFDQSIAELLLMGFVTGLLTFAFLHLIFYVVSLVLWS